MLRFARSSERWWQKPLVDAEGRPLPAELCVLRAEVRPGEAGAWLNSRSVESGVADLVRDHTGALVTARVALPAFVGRALRTLYDATGLSKGAPDLVIWNALTYEVRLVEVKNPSRDAPTDQQRQFLAAAAARGIPTAIVEWEFPPDPG